MGLRVFISSVTDREAAATNQPDPLRKWLAENLERARTEFIRQEGMVDQGVHTLVRLARDIERVDLVLHILSDDPGRLPSDAKAVRELLAHCGEQSFRARFGELFEEDLCLRLSYTQWEAWIARFYDRDVLCFRHARDDVPAAPGGSANEKTLSVDEHLRLLRPYAGFPVEFESQEELVRGIQTALLQRLNSDKMDSSRRSKWAPTATAALLFLCLAAVVAIVTGLGNRHGSDNSNGSSVVPTVEPDVPSVLFTNRDTATDVERLASCNPDDVADSMRECVDPWFGRLADVADGGKLDDDDLYRFVSVFVRRQQRSQVALLPIADEEASRVRSTDVQGVLRVALASNNPLVHELATEFREEPAKLLTLLQEICHD